MRALPYILCAILLAGVGVLMWLYLDCRSVNVPDDRAIREAAKADSLEQVTHNARGDSLKAQSDTIQLFRDSLKNARKPIQVIIDDTRKAMADAPLSVLIDSLELQPIGR